MKTTIILMFFLFGLNLHSQTYVLDSSFGNSGTMQYNNGLYHVKNGLLVNNNYYFISNTTIAKVDYSGQIVSAFGVNGYKTLQQTNETLNISDFTFYNNYFYLYGSVKNNTTNNIDIYISKVDETGNYDTNFGANGILKLDFEPTDSITSFLIEPSGNLYCIGTKYNQNITNSSRLVLFKINSNGTLNTSFDTNGFKEINLNLYTSGASIIFYNNTYMLLGTTTEFDGASNRRRIMISQVDINGNLDTSFGTNGFKVIPLESFGIYYNTINSVQLLNNKLYINMNQGGAMLGDNDNKLLIYDLINDQIISSIGQNQFIYTKVDNDGAFMTSYCYTCCGNNYYACDNTFELRKKNLDGTTDSTFHINGTYSYEFSYTQPAPTIGDSRSYVFIKEPSGKFLIAGFVYNFFSTPGFSAIRITPGTLNLNSIVLNDNNSIFPNPFNDKIIFKNTTPLKNITIYDLIGRKVIEPPFQYENTSSNIDLSNILEKGTYLIKITTEKNEIITKKIIKN